MIDLDKVKKNKNRRSAQHSCAKKFCSPDFQSPPQKIYKNMLKKIAYVIQLEKVKLLETYIIKYKKLKHE